jgi:capsular polysaccharide biosynthesis protein
MSALRDLRRHALHALTQARATLPAGLNDTIFHLPTGNVQLIEACGRAGVRPMQLGEQRQGWPTILEGSDPELTGVLLESCRRSPPDGQHLAATLPSCRILGRECTAIAAGGLVLTDVSPDDHATNRPHRALATRIMALPPRRLPGITALLGDVGHRNIFHWFFDILPRAAMLRAAGCPEPDRWVIPKSRLPIVPELLRAAGVPMERCVHMSPWSHVSCEWLQLTTAPGRICEPQPHAVHALRGWLRPTTAERSPRLVVIGRRGRRKLANMDALMAALDSYQPALVHLEGKSLAQQVDALAGARCIVGPHGAGLAHMIHAAPGASVIEFLPEHYPNPSFFHLAGACGLRYGCIRARTAPGASGSPTTRDLVIEVDHARAIVDHTLRD